MCLCVGMCTWVAWRSEASGAGGTGSCELLNMGAKNRAQSLCKRRAISAAPKSLHLTKNHDVGIEGLVTA